MRLFGTEGCYRLLVKLNQLWMKRFFGKLWMRVDMPFYEGPWLGFFPIHDMDRFFRAEQRCG